MSLSFFKRMPSRRMKKDKKSKSLKTLSEDEPEEKSFSPQPDVDPSASYTTTKLRSGKPPTGLSINTKRANLARSTSLRSPSYLASPGGTSELLSPTLNPSSSLTSPWTDDEDVYTARMSGLNASQLDQGVEYKVGDDVFLLGDREGTIRYKGEVHFSKGIWYGVELTDLSAGKHSGTVDGHHYFDTTLPGRGIFVRSKKIIRKMRDRDINNPKRLHRRALSRQIYANKDKKIADAFAKPRASAVITAAAMMTFSDVESDFSTPPMTPTTSNQFRFVVSDTDEPPKPSSSKRRSSREEKRGQRRQLSAVVEFEEKEGFCYVFEVPLPDTDAMNVLEFLMMNDVANFALVSKAAKKLTRFVDVMDMRHLLRELLTLTQTRKVMSIFLQQTVRKWIIPVAMLLWDPIVRAILTKHWSKEELKELIFDDRDIRPNRFLLAPSNFPWSEVEEEMGFPKDLIEVLGNVKLETLDLRFAPVIRLEWFEASRDVVTKLGVGSPNCEELSSMRQIESVLIEDKENTMVYEELDLRIMNSWSRLSNLQTMELSKLRFTCSITDLFNNLRKIPMMNDLVMRACKFRQHIKSSVAKRIIPQQDRSSAMRRIVIIRQRISKIWLISISLAFGGLERMIWDQVRIPSPRFDVSSLRQLDQFKEIELYSPRLPPSNEHMRSNDWLPDFYDNLQQHLATWVKILVQTLTFELRSHNPCPKCHTLTRDDMLRDHLMSVCPEMVVFCPVCDAIVVRHALTKHWEFNCSKYTLICPLCPDTFEYRDEINDHVAKHTLRADYECGRYDLYFDYHAPARKMRSKFNLGFIKMCEECTRRYFVAPNMLQTSKWCPDCHANRDNTATDVNERRLVLPPYPEDIQLKSTNHRWW